MKKVKFGIEHKSNNLTWITDWTGGLNFVSGIGMNFEFVIDRSKTSTRTAKVNIKKMMNAVGIEPVFFYPRGRGVRR